MTVGTLSEHFQHFHQSVANFGLDKRRLIIAMLFLTNPGRNQFVFNGVIHDGLDENRFGGIDSGDDYFLFLERSRCCGIAPKPNQATGRGDPPIMAVVGFVLLLVVMV